MMHARGSLQTGGIRLMEHPGLRETEQKAWLQSSPARSGACDWMSCISLTLAHTLWRHWEFICTGRLFFFFPQILARPWTREHHSSEECYKILLSSVCHLILISALILAWQYCMSLSDQGTQWPREHTHYFSQFPYTFPKGLDIMLWANSTSNNKGKYFMLRASLGRRTGSALYSETSDVTVFCHGSKLITKWQFFSAKNISRVTLIEISRVQIPT